MALVQGKALHWRRALCYRYLLRQSPASWALPGWIPFAAHPQPVHIGLQSLPGRSATTGPVVYLFRRPIRPGSGPWKTVLVPAAAATSRCVISWPAWCKSSWPGSVEAGSPVNDASLAKRRLQDRNRKLPID
jgi:hypothetical protein